MDLVKALREGNHDKVRPADTASIEPKAWEEHFSQLLGKAVPPTVSAEYMREYITRNSTNISSELDEPFTKKELALAFKNLKNNKASAFDQISNEMLKAGENTLKEPLLLLFNTILSNNIYPSGWKLDILGPLHKSGPKDDPNNFRGICVSSCLGKLFNTLLRNRLEQKCLKEELIDRCQISGRKAARTADHLLVLQFLIKNK